MRLFKIGEPWRTLIKQGTDGWTSSKPGYDYGLVKGSLGLRAFGGDSVALCDSHFKKFCVTSNNEVRAFFAECLLKATPEEPK